MPLQLPTITAPPPEPAIGATPSAPLNNVMGLGGSLGTSLLTIDKYGLDVGAAAWGSNLAFQFVKFLPFNQHIWWPIILLVITFGILLLLNQGAWVPALRGAMPGAVQSAFNYELVKGVGGINAFPSAPDP